LFILFNSDRVHAARTTSNIEIGRLTNTLELPVVDAYSPLSLDENHQSHDEWQAHMHLLVF